ncbi:MAG: RluA family pseudouridine synthase [Clostridiales bacterium]|nr:RluA family pseudouridine synthase [Clostridiales bacterium]
MKHYNEYLITEEHSGKSIKDYLKNHMLISNRTLVKLKKNSSILLNGEAVYVTKKLKAGDRLEIILLDEESKNVIPEAIDLDIIYEDDYIIAVNKPPDMPVHPTRGHLTGTLANALAYYYMNVGRSIKIRPINRLDKDTSGVVIFAKNSHIQYLMSKEDSFISKEYIAIVKGMVSKDREIIDLPIKRENEYSIKRIVNEEGQKSITAYEVIDKNEKSSLLRIDLITGRTHQIRVHMSHIGHPLIGDELYGEASRLIHRQGLHAEKISFIHPVTREPIELYAGIPDDIKKLINMLGLKYIL